MAESEYWYNYYRQKYYDSCSEINNCDHHIYNLKNGRRQVVNKINQLKTDIRNTQEALSSLEAVIKKEGSISSKLAVVAEKTNQTAVNFSGMVKASDIQSKNIADVYGDEAAKTRNTLNNVWSILGSKKSNLNTSLSNLQADLNRADSDLQNIDSDMKRISADMSYWKQQKTSNYYNMEYYRRKMLQEAW